MRRQVLTVGAMVLGFGLAGCHPVTTAAGGGSVDRASASATAGPSAGAGAGHGSAAKALAALAVHPKGSMSGYDRLKFGAAWTDDNSDPDGHNHCDTRNDILARDLTSVTYKSGHCTIATGTLKDPYTGSTIHFVRGPESTKVQIDHVVPLGDAWVTGAAQLSATVRLNLAEDPLELLAADGPANEAKGDDDASQWLPANTSFRCTYVAKQIAVKAKYKLWVTAAERAAMQKVLSGCPTQKLPTE